MSNPNLTTSANDFLVKAYLRNPYARMNFSSIQLFNGNYKEHNAAPIVPICELLSNDGYIILDEVTEWREECGQGIVALFALTPLGKIRAEEILKKRRKLTLRDRIAEISRSDWVALAALLVSIIALFISGS